MNDDAIEDALGLLDWRRQVAELYTAVRAGAGWTQWCETRRALFTGHEQSPVPRAERAAFEGPHVYPYDPQWRTSAALEPADPGRFELPTSQGSAMAFSRIARARFTVGDAEHELDVFLLDGYGGGLFVPFADATSGQKTYGAGRYLLDTIKGADLGEHDGRLILDFNFAYQPSCSYDSRWLCPLAPPANRLPCPVEAGERLAPA